MSNHEDLIEALSRVLRDSGIDAASALRDSLKKQPLAVTHKAYSDGYYEQHADDYIDFTYKNPTIYHVVKTFAQDLQDAGFLYLAEKDSWAKLKPGKYYTTRNGLALLAFVVGKDWTPARGVGVVGSHIDALTVALKPNSSKTPVDGYELLGVAPYAGALSNLWWDRDLGLGGRILVKTEAGTIEQRLVDSTPHPIAKVPTLAPHFGAPASGPFNPETQAVPVIGVAPSGAESELEATDDEKKAPLYGKHPLRLLRYVAKKAGVAVADIVLWDLQLYDVQKGVRGGLDHEFVFAPRVDDRVCSYAAVHGLIEAEAAGKLTADSFTAVGLFDNEEIGSGTRTGIKGQLLEATVTRVLSSESFGGPGGVEEKLRVAYANTIIVLADVNHLVNPNFSGVYLEHHKPVPNVGVTVSLDPNGHMATDAVGLALVEEVARKNGDQLQYFQIRNDSRLGGTIGPFVLIQTGARTIDLGIPQLSMHSIRATLGYKDIGLGVKFFTGFFEHWRATYDNYGDL